MKLKGIEKIINNIPPHMVGNGFRVNTFFPSESISMKRMSPFLLFDYNANIEFSPSENPRGVGVHPHRGFETVTIAYKGSVAHHDSAGNSGVIQPGEVQWMTAGSGILHKEYHEEEFSRKGGIFQMVQLWVNLPAKFKGNSPKYQSLNPNNYGKIAIPNDFGEIEIIAGELNGVLGAAQTFSPINIYNATFLKGGRFDFTFKAEWNVAIMVIEGKIKAQDQSVLADSFILFDSMEGHIQIDALEDAKFLVISGEPILEPIAAHGPFVMNTHQELEIAFQDYNAGKYGKLE